MSIAREKDSLPHIVEFDGLRGYLAWWVVLFHSHLQSGLYTLHLKPIRLTLGQGFLAVPIFFILSGFVIAYLEDTRRESYGIFLVRRFFRLAPVYYLVLALGIIDAWRAGTYGDTLWAHVLAHVTMLHSAVPISVLPGSLHALDWAAWSVSVEWQFYLLAPLVIAAVQKSPSRAIGVLALFGLASYLFDKVPLLTVDESAIIFQRAGIFAAGIGSYFLFKFATTHVAVVKGAIPYFLPFALAIAWTCGGPTLFAGPIWLILFPAVLAYYCGAETLVTKPLRLALRAPVMVWLGRISYCTYLCHSRVIAAVDRTIIPRMGVQSPWSKFFLLVVIGYPLVALVSELIHRLVEKPAIQFGKWLVKGFGPVPKPSAVPSEVTHLEQASSVS